MTVVIAETEQGIITMAADSAATNGDEIYTLKTPKVFQRDGYLFGHCGCYRIGQILRHCVELPQLPSGSTEVERFLIRELAPALREAVEAEGAAGGGGAFLGEKTCILIGLLGQIWCMRPDLSVMQEGPFAAIGSGRLRAYAVLHALHAIGFGGVRRRIEIALEATAEYTSSVRPPWHFVNSDDF